MLNSPWMEHLTSGQSCVDVYTQEYRRIMLMYALTLMLALSLLLLTVYHFISGNYLFGIGIASFSALSMYTLFAFKRHRDLERATTLGTFAIFICLLLFITLNENRDYGLIWSIFFPIYVFSVKGVKRGLLYTLIYYAVLFSIAYDGIGVWDDGRWNMTGYLRFVIASAVLTYAAYSFERVNDMANELLEAARERESRRLQVLENLSVTDPLTGLYNRRHLDAVFMRLFNSAKRHNYIFALYVVDLEYFKGYNDRYGHHAGDSVLEKVAEVFRHSLRRSDDYVFRLGGEEFCCIVTGDTEHSVIDPAQRLCREIEALGIEHQQSDVSAVVTASIGICLIDHVDHETYDTMYKVADAALYKAKEEGRNRVVVYRSRDV